jgi:AcrR family transcriptional regulator
MEVAVERLMREWPLPDTGSIRGDLSLWARRIAASLGGPEGSPFLRTFIATVPPPGAERLGRVAALGRRVEQIETMLARARERGEAAPTIADVLDHLLAPLYMRTLFGAPVNAAFADQLADRLIRAA